MLIEEDNEDVLIHYGILRRSGRYPWGSGGNEDGINQGFLEYVREMERQGLSQATIAKGIGEKNPNEEVSVNRLRATMSYASNALKQSKIAQAQRLRDKGMSPTEISRTMNAAESTVRGWLAPGAADRADILTSTANMLKNEVAKKTFVDVGKGAETYKAGVSRTRLDVAVQMLKDQGYEVHLVKIPQQSGSQKFTTTKVLCPPGTTQKDVFLNQGSIKQITDFSDDHGRTYGHLHPPLEIDPSRVKVVFKEDGGDKADGMLYVRPNVEDVSIGGKSYAQVRVAVGPDHYLKGMAIYKSDLPDGVDIEFHTSKPRTSDPLDAMKANVKEPGYLAIGEHPLMKSVTRQILADPGTDNERVTSAMNIVNEEGDWANWSHNFSSQMLSKQKPTLAQSQLAESYAARLKDFEETNALTNPTVRKKLLETFSDEADSAAVHLKAAALPRTGSHVILPLPNMKPGEIYAPKFHDGERVVLIRHPHAGPFEIPELVVNNKNREARRILGNNPEDAVGIHPSVAQHLSGADYDGDTVLVIPNDKGKIHHEKALDALKDFDPKSAYPGYEGMKIMSNTQTEMGMISNLITDMSIQGAPHDELARAVKHSMVVIDAEKHGLDYKLSYQQNGIKHLKEKYQTGGASTLISRARAQARIPETRARRAGEGGPIDLTTGEKVFVPTGRLKKDGTPSLVKIHRLANTNDARTLMSSPAGTRMENIYADHSNKLKVLANRARLEAHAIPNAKYSPSAKKAYKAEVESLNNKLYLANRNRPLERQANIIAAAQSKARISANPSMDEDTKKKIRRQALQVARSRVGATKSDIKFTSEEWDAIQAGAISHSKLLELLSKADMDNVRSLATPRPVHLMTASKTSRARQMLANGATRAEVARALGVSLTTLDVAVKGG